MGKIGGALFGSPSKSQTVTPTAFKTLPQSARTAIHEFIGAGRGFLEDPSIFEAVDPLPEQQRALEILAGAAEPLTQQRFGQAFDIFFNPFVEQTVDPVLADIERVGRSAFGNLGAQAAQAGAFGGTRQAVREAELGRELGREAGRASSLLRSQAFESAADRALNQIANESVAALASFQTGEAIRQLQQQTRLAPAAAAEFLASLVSRVPAGGGTVATARGEQQGIIPQLLGTSLGTQQAPTFLGSILSDIRLKENVQFLRKEGGHNIYRFKYKENPGFYEGVMAHEVYSIKPEAVKLSNGYLTVDYSLIKPEFREAA